MRKTRHLFAPDVLTAPTEPKRRGTKRKSAALDFAFQCEQNELPPRATEHRFAKSIGRQWRFDFAFPDYMLAVEIEGLVVRRIAGEMVCTGRHASVQGFREDCLKYASAAVLGWNVIRFEQSQVRARVAIEYTMRVLVARGWTVPNE